MTNYFRRTVLFEPDTSFATKNQFYATCRSALRNAYRWPGEISRNEPKVAGMRCGRRSRFKHDCPFRVVCRLTESGRWEMDGESTSWGHSHSPGEPGEDEDGAGEDEEEVQSEEESVQDTSSSRNPLATSSVPQLHIPNFPSPTDTFPTFRALHHACALAVMPVYGCSVGPPGGNNSYLRCGRARPNVLNGPEGKCPWYLATRQDRNGRWMVDYPASKLHHNHGKMPKIVNNPDWRPFITNTELRQAMEKQDAKRRRDKLDSCSTPAPATKRPRLSAPLPSSSSLPSAPPSTASPPTLFQTLPTSSSHKFSLSTVPHPPAPHRHPELDLSNHPFLPTLTSFLLALSPSLSPLAPTLLAAGVDSSDALVALTLCEGEMVRAFVDHLAQGGGGGVGLGRPSAIQVKLLVKGLTGMRASVRGGAAVKVEQA